MITWVEGDDIFKIEGDIYVITVNTVGVMGTGLADSFKKRCPLLYEQYRRDCRAKRLRIGAPLIYVDDQDIRYMMFPTKESWRNPSEYPYISASLSWMRDAVGTEIEPEERIVMSPLGCHNGGLSFHAVSLMIDKYCSEMPTPITVVYPWYQPPHPTLMTEGSSCHEKGNFPPLRISLSTTL